MRIVKSPEDRKQEILDTAMELFFEKGYDKTSISDIANKLGVAQGLCYRYFKSKEELFDCAIDHYADMQVYEMKKTLFNDDTSLLDKINSNLGFMNFEKEDNYYYKVFHGKDSRKIHDQLSLKICEKVKPIFNDILKKEIEKGNLKIDDPDTVAAFCSYGQLGILFRNDLSNEEKMDKIKKFYLSILK